MSLSPITLRNGFYAEQVSGIGLSDVQLGSALDQRALSQDLERTIRDAMATARQQGMAAFEPDSALMALPTDDASYRDRVRALFAQVLNTPFSPEDEQLYPDLPPYGALSLAQWSSAEQQLAQYAARLTSSLSPGDGGGVQHARGQWFVNGQVFSLAEMVMTIRLGNLNGLDSVLEADLNAMVANTELAKQLMAIVNDMKLRRAQEELEVADAITSADDANAPVIFDAETEYQAYVNAVGLTTEALAELGVRFKGEASALANAELRVIQDGSLTEAEYEDAIKELQSIFDSINSQNDVKRVMIENRQNERSNLLLSMSDFYKGANAVAQDVAKMMEKTR